jgi:hypothetical protein
LKKESVQAALAYAADVVRHEAFLTQVHDQGMM